MNEVMIDMSSMESPVSSRTLLETASPCQCALANLSLSETPAAAGSTADTQNEWQLSITPQPTPDFVYREELLRHFRELEESAKEGAGSLGAGNDRHEITAQLRAKMVDWMVEVIYKSECPAATLFSAVGLLDRFLMRTSQRYKAADLHLIGVIAMLLASKLQDVSGLDIHFMYEQVVHKKVSPQEMVSFELTILQAVGFDVSAPTELDILGVLMGEFTDCDAGAVLRQAKNTAMFNLYDKELSAIRPSLRAAATLLISLKDNTQEVEEARTRSQIWIHKLCKASGTQETQLAEVCKLIQSHKTNFAQLHPKLKNALTYGSSFIS